jgi:hypothetical protein
VMEAEKREDTERLMRKNGRNNMKKIEKKL